MTERTSLLSLALLIALSLLWSGCRATSEMPMGQSTPSPTESPLVAEVTQELDFGEVHQIRPGSPDTMFATTGRQLYVIGDIDGDFRPRTNPYDLAAFGEPRADDPLGGELGGVWAQPVKALDGYVFAVEVNGERWPLLDANRFTQTFADVRFNYRKDTLVATRRQLAMPPR